MKCVACGSTNLIEGTVQGEDASVMGFQPNDATWVKRALAFGRRGIRAYGCMHCQHLQLAVDFNEKDRDQYQQFEGQQPSLMERIE